MATISCAAVSFPILEMDYTSYHVIGRTTTGARFYSEKLGLADAFKYYEDYKGLVDYFGGGEVELIASAYDAVLTIKTAKI